MPRVSSLAVGRHKVHDKYAGASYAYSQEAIVNEADDTAAPGPVMAWRQPAQGPAPSAVAAESATSGSLFVGERNPGVASKSRFSHVSLVAKLGISGPQPTTHTRYG